jgi:hypothetical protein
MASKKTKDDQVSGEGKSSAKEKATRSVADAATDLIGEVERTAETLTTEVKQLFDSLTEKVAATASAAAETTASVAGKVGVKDPSQLIRGLLGEVKAAGETSLNVISEGFNTLRRQLHSPANNEGKPPKEMSNKAKERKKGGDSAQQGDPSQAETAPMQSRDATATPSAKQRATTKKVAKKKAATAKKASPKAPAAEEQAKPEAATAKVGKKVAARQAAAKKTPAKKKAAAKKASVKKKTVPEGDQSGSDV